MLAQEQGSIFQQLVSLLLCLIAALYLLANIPVAQKMLSPLFLMVLFWQFITVFTSDYPDIAFRRYIFSITLIIMAMAWVLLPEDELSFQRMIKYLSLFILGLAYFGVIFMPDVSIHNMSEVRELINAGSWRGHFVHKNIAGPAMIVLIIYNLYLLHRDQFYLPLTNIILSTIFLYYSNNKTSIGLIIVSLLIAQAIKYTRLLPIKIIIAFIPLILMASLTVGTIFNQSLQDLVSSLISDPTFTGRTSIWTFIVSQLEAHPWIGYGYETFWNMSRLVNGGYDIETWAARAGHAHNGYLQLIILTGTIGVSLFAVWILFCPLIDYHRSQKTRNDPALGLMYLRIWVFMLLYANLESPFFAPRGQVWFSLLTAIFALRLHARTHLR
ncbi:O-antigen ligase family protein [Pseudochrobactrum sp. HB0163]|uniref:O-antigen ligase family protein n=1 Tax=Pseudochrobactrum sp. HB0163 TaxID=3450708 RepID=UPI003F6E1D82